VALQSENASVTSSWGLVSGESEGELVKSDSGTGEGELVNVTPRGEAAQRDDT